MVGIAGDAWRRPLARDHAAPESTLALSKADQPCCGRVRPLAWCSRPRDSAASLGGALDFAGPGAVVGSRLVLSTRRRRLMPEQSVQKRGQIVEIKGVVIDAVFPEGLPEIYTALRIEIPALGEQEARTLIAEVQQHLGDDRLRAVAMDSTDGLARGLEVHDTGQPISVPVGDVTLGRIWNVIGEPVDEKPAAPADTERW